MREQRWRNGDLQSVTISVAYHGRPVSIRLHELPTGWSWAWSTPRQRGFVTDSGTALDEDDARRAAFASLRQAAR